jgi:hypothetical protein
MKRFVRRPSPAMIIALVALIAALGGTAIAKKGGDKKSDKKIANKVVTKRAPGLSVASAKTANVAQSPVAWAHVDENGNLLGSSSNINQSNVDNPFDDGEYCFHHLTFAFQTIQASVDGARASTQDDIAQVGVPDPADCRAGSGFGDTQAGVQTIDAFNDNSFDPAGIYVWFFN